LVLAVALPAAGCDIFESDEDSKIYDVVTRFEADDGAPASKAGAIAASSSRRYTLASAGILDGVCGDGQIICLTPETLAGRIYAGGLMVGGREGPGYHVTTIGATPEVLQRPDLGRGGTLTFDVASTTDFSGGYNCCGGSPYPEDDQALISRIEMTFDYLDMTFTVPAEAGDDLAGVTYVLRQVYVDTATAPDVNGPMYIGDKLVRRADEQMFRWCDADDCSHSERPEDGGLKAPNIQLEPDREGNKHYATFGVPLENNETVPFTMAEAQEGNWLFHVAFDLSDAAVFSLTDWSQATSEHAMVEAFHLIDDPFAPHTSVRVKLSKEKVEALPAATE